MTPELYIEDDCYDTLADFVRLVLRLSHDAPADERRQDFATLAEACSLFPGAAECNREALAEALSAFTPAGADDWDIRDVRWMLGEEGGIFPERARGDDVPALPTAA